MINSFRKLKDWLLPPGKFIACPDIEIYQFVSYAKRYTPSLMKDFVPSLLKDRKSACPDICIGSILDAMNEFISKSYNIDKEFISVFGVIALNQPITLEQLKRYFLPKDIAFDYELNQDDVESAVELLIECGKVVKENNFYRIK